MDSGGSCRRRGNQGFSFAELLVVITVVGIMAAVAIPAFIGVLGGSKDSVASSNLEYLNQGVWKYGHAGAQITNATGETATVLALLRTRDAHMPGSPYLEAALTTNLSSDTNGYRAVWNGTLFEMKKPGDSGTGLDLLKIYK